MWDWAALNTCCCSIKQIQTNKIRLEDVMDTSTVRTNGNGRGWGEWRVGGRQPSLSGHCVGRTAPSVADACRAVPCCAVLHPALPPLWHVQQQSRLAGAARPAARQLIEQLIKPLGSAGAAPRCGVCC